MTKNEVREETRRRLSEIHLDLAHDEVEVDRQMPDVHRRLIIEADAARDHYIQIATEALTPRYGVIYSQHADRWAAKGEALRALQL